MKVKSIKSVGKLPVYDISVDSENYDDQQYVLENGVVTHNTGIYYSANTIFIIGRQQEKGADGEIDGYHFVINVEKSRFVKEKAKIPVSVTWEGGVSKYSGILDLALESGHVVKPSNGWYQLADPSTGEIFEGKVRLKDTNTKEFLGKVLLNTDFHEYVKSKYKAVGVNRLNDGDIDLVEEPEIEETE